MIVTVLIKSMDLKSCNATSQIDIDIEISNHAIAIACKFRLRYVLLTESGFLETNIKTEVEVASEGNKILRVLYKTLPEKN